MQNYNKLITICRLKFQSLDLENICIQWTFISSALGRRIISELMTMIRGQTLAAWVPMPQLLA